MGLRNLFGGTKQHNRRPDRAPAVRLGVESLEDRVTPNVSSVFDASGNFFQAVVHQNGNLVLTGPSGAQTLATTGVRVAHLFRDTTGGVGIDVVRSNGRALDAHP